MKEQEKQLLIRRRRAMLLNSMSNDLQGPLNVILNGVELLETTLAPNPESGLKESLQAIADSARLIDRASVNLLDVMAAMADCTQVNLVPCALYVQLHSLLEQVAPYAAQRGLNLLCLKEVPLACLNLDPALLDRVLLSILSNAIQHSPQGGTIQVQTAKQENLHIITVRDEGTGIDQSILDEVFGLAPAQELRFGQPKQGTGLMLANEFCKAMNWQLQIETSTHGTAVSVCIPAQATELDQPLALHSDAVEQALQAQEQQKRVRREMWPLTLQPDCPAQ